MKVFFDTSSLFKLYHYEQGTPELIDFLNNHFIEEIFLSELSYIEFSSVVWKKCRMNEIDEKSSKKLLQHFHNDVDKFSFILIDKNIRNASTNLIEKHWKRGLRTLDSIQLASSLQVKDKIEVFFSSDIILSELASFEGLSIM